MKTKYLTLILLLLSVVLYSQEKLTVDWAFSTTDGDLVGGHTELKSIAVDDFGNVYAFGHYNTTMDADPTNEKAILLSQGNFDVFLVKYDSVGNHIWSISMGTLTDDNAYSVAIDRNNDVLITGSFEGTVDFDATMAVANLTSNGGVDFFVAKYNSEGDYQWAINVGGFSNDYSSEITVDINNDIIVTGGFDAKIDFNPSAAIDTLSPNGSSDIFLTKYGTDGAYKWTKSFGGIGPDYGYGLAVDSNNDILLIGAFQDTVDFDASDSVVQLVSQGYYDVFLSKYDEDGNYVWVNQIGGSNSEKGVSVAVDGNDAIIITGEFRDTVDFDPSVNTANVISNDYIDCFLAKYNSDGTYVWAKDIGGANGDYARAVALDGNDDVILVGDFLTTADFDPSTSVANLTSEGNRDIFIAKYTSSGTYVWAKRIGNFKEDKGLDIAVNKLTNDIFLAGYFQFELDSDPGVDSSMLLSSWRNGILGKYRPNGDYAWAHAMGMLNGFAGSDGESKESVIDSEGNVYVVGHFFFTVDFDPSDNVANLTTNGAQDIFLAKYDIEGNYIWAINIGGAGADAVGGIAMDENEDIIITGNFQDTIDFDPSVVITTLAASTTSPGVFIAKYTSSGALVWAKKLGGDTEVLGDGIATDADNNIIVVGSYRGTLDCDPSFAIANITSNGHYDLFLAKYTSSGDYEWSLSIGGSHGHDYANAVSVDNTGKVVVVGVFVDTVDCDPSGAVVNLVSDGNSNTDMLVAMYNEDGTYAWAKNIGNAREEAATDIDFDSNDNFFITGYFEGTSDFNPGGVAITLTSNGESDMFLAKYNNAGNCLWANNMGSIYDDKGYGLAVDVNDDIVVAGTFQDSIDFTTNSFLLPKIGAAGGVDIAIAKYDGDGNSIWANKVGGINENVVNGITVGSDNTIVIAGYFQGYADYGVGGATEFLVAENAKDPFVALYRACNPIFATDNQTACTSYTWIDGNTYTSSNSTATHTLFGGASSGCDSTVTLNLTLLAATDVECEDQDSISSIEGNALFNSVSIYPNPNSGIVNIEFGALRNVSVNVSSIGGQLVYQDDKIRSATYTFDLDVVAGMYIVALRAEGQVEHYKLIVK